MIAPLFTLCKASAQVLAIFGAPNPRIYGFGEAPPNVARPYAVWQNIGGGPDNCLDTPPDSDAYSVQIDVYANTSTDATAGAGAIMLAIETEGYVTAYNGTMTDPETNLKRYSFSADFITPR